MFRILITGPAKNSIQSNHDWWAEHHSADEASRWYRGIFEAINSLERLPERCPNAPESDSLHQSLRQLLFGIGKRPTHRIVFTIAENDVIVLAIRHASQDALTHHDL